VPEVRKSWGKKMIIVITVKEKNQRTGQEKLVVSHGIDEYTGKSVILPCEPPERIGAKFDQEIGEYVLPERSAVLRL
jgi:hypothetical protein